MIETDVLKWYRDTKRELCCRRCGLQHEAVIELHHINPEEKKHTVSHMVHHHFPLSAIKEEFSKTVPLCANCHKIHHYNINHGYTDNRWPHDEGFHVG